MLLTTVLLFMGMRGIFGWNRLLAGAAACALFVVDTAFVSSNLLKIADGVYVPVLVAAGALHEQVFILTVVTQMVPMASVEQRLTYESVVPGLWRSVAHFGFTERPDVPAVLPQAQHRGCGIDLSDVTYFVGHETVVRRDDGKGLPGWVEAMFAFMQRNSAHVTDYFRLPADTAVEVGREVAI
ncbi:MAG TPA: KUP/HAK/KT family potassium transporter [Rhodopila sp.]|jgi:K+ transporter